MSDRTPYLRLSSPGKWRGLALLALLFAADNAATTQQQVVAQQGNIAQQSGDSVSNTPDRSPVTALAVSPDGQLVLAGGEFGIELYQMPGSTEQDKKICQTLEPSERFQPGFSDVQAIAFSSDGKQVAIAGGTPGESGQLEIRNVASREVVCSVSPHQDLIYDLCWSPDGKFLATASYDRDVKILNASDGSVVRTLAGHSRPVLAIGWLADGKTLTTAGVDRSLRVWNAETGELVRSQENHTQTITDLCERPTSAAGARPLILTAGADKTIRFWQPTIGRLVRFARLDAIPLAAGWTPGGELALAACEDGQLRSIDPDTAEVATLITMSNARLESLIALPDSNSGRFRVIAGDARGRVLFWIDEFPAAGK